MVHSQNDFLLNLLFSPIGMEYADTGGHQEAARAIGRSYQCNFLGWGFTFHHADNIITYDFDPMGIRDIFHDRTFALL